MATPRTTDQVIRDYVRFSAGADRAELARALDLPTPTVISAVRRLLAAGELVEGATPRTHSGAGRPARLLQAPGPAPMCVLVQWQEREIRLSCLDFAGETLSETRVATPVPSAGEHDLEGLLDHAIAMAQAHPDRSLVSVVFSVPAPFLPSRGTPLAPAVAGQDPVTFSVSALGNLEDHLGRRHGIPVFIENDANLSAIAEQRLGAGRDLGQFVYLRLTANNFGSAIVANGELVRGVHGYAGEIAHLQMDVEGPLCACGGRGCLHAMVKSVVVEAAQSAYDRPIVFADLPGLASSGDVGAGRLLRDFGRTVGRPLAHLCTFLDPARLIVDTTLGSAVDHVVAGIQESLAVQAPPVIAECVDVVASPLGDRAEIFGALELPRAHLRRRLTASA